MNKKNINKTDIIIIICIICILIYSILLIYSANINNKNNNIIYKKFFHIIISLIIMFHIIKFNKKYYINNAYIIYIICNLLLIYTYLYGYITNGAKRWIDIKIIKFQPSEIAKISVPILITKILKKNNYLINNIKIITLIIIITLIPSILIYLQPDLGTSILILLYGVIGLYLGGINKKIILISIILLILSIPFIWKFLLYKYQKNRIITLFNNNNDILNNGYQINQSKIAIGSGGLYGKGIFLGTQSKFNFIPENKTDFIFTLIAEEHGFIGILFILLIYLILITRSLIICINNNDIFNKLLISNLIINFCIHIIINIGMVIGLFPIVGVPLPLISYGGTSLIVTISMFAIIMSLKKNI